MKRQSIFGVLSEKKFKKEKNLPDLLNREEKAIEKLFNCKASSRNKIAASQFPKFKKLLILGNECGIYSSFG